MLSVHARDLQQLDWSVMLPVPAAYVLRVFDCASRMEHKEIKARRSLNHLFSPFVCAGSWMCSACPPGTYSDLIGLYRCLLRCLRTCCGPSFLAEPVVGHVASLPVVMRQDPLCVCMIGKL